MRLPAAIVLKNIARGSRQDLKRSVHWSGAAVDERVTDELAVGCLHYEARDAAAAHVKHLIVADNNMRAFDPHAALAGATNGVVANRHVAHGVAKNIDAIAQHVCDRALSLAADDRVFFNEDCADVGRAGSCLHHDAIAAGGQFRIAHVDQIISDDHVFEMIGAFVNFEIDVGAAGPAGLPGSQKPVSFKDDVAAVNERQVLRSDTREQAVGNLGIVGEVSLA